MADMQNSTPASCSSFSFNTDTPSEPLWYHEAEDRIHEKYSGEMNEIVAIILFTFQLSDNQIQVSIHQDMLKYAIFE